MANDARARNGEQQVQPRRQTDALPLANHEPGVGRTIPLYWHLESRRYRCNAAPNLQKPHVHQQKSTRNGATMIFQCNLHALSPSRLKNKQRAIGAKCGSAKNGVLAKQMSVAYLENNQPRQILQALASDIRRTRTAAELKEMTVSQHVDATCGAVGPFFP